MLRVRRQSPCWCQFVSDIFLHSFWRGEHPCYRMPLIFFHQIGIQAFVCQQQKQSAKHTKKQIGRSFALLHGRRIPDLSGEAGPVCVAQYYHHQSPSRKTRTKGVRSASLITQYWGTLEWKVCSWAHLNKDPDGCGRKGGCWSHAPLLMSVNQNIWICSGAFSWLAHAHILKQHRERE